ncbi:MAG: glucosamine-6-phosphate deaminase [Oscillospiraceae bacterium]
MRIYQSEDYQGMSRRAASIIAAQIINKPDCVLGLATGSTPIGAYQQLIEMYKAGDLSFAEVKSVNLDEYKGLSPKNDQSYRYFMQHNLFDHVNINVANTNVPQGEAADADAECARYDRLIDDLGGVDLQLLGMGLNGHIGFNEPCASFATGTHVVDLTESTIAANSRFFSSMNDVPRQALTMGNKNIMDAKQILIMVSGEAKADIVCKAFSGPVCPEVPASILQLHKNVILVGDRAALCKLLETGAALCK